MARLVGVRSRREMLREGAIASVGAILVGSGPASLLAAATQKSKVVLIRDKDVFAPDGQARAEVVQSMLDAAVLQVTGDKDPVAAWGAVHPRRRRRRPEEQRLGAAAHAGGGREGDRAPRARRGRAF